MEINEIRLVGGERNVIFFVDKLFDVFWVEDSFEGFDVDFLVELLVEFFDLMVEGGLVLVDGINVVFVDDLKNVVVF